ncbi:MAG TPA: hypothetical protein VF157_03890 [Chloroflexota bacterium]
MAVVDTSDMSPTLLHPVMLTAIQAEPTLPRTGQVAGIVALVLCIVAFGLVIS